MHVTDTRTVAGRDAEIHIEDEAVDLSGTVPEAWAALALFWALGATVFYQFVTRYVFNDSAAFNKQVHLLWLGAGTAETQIHDGVQSVHEALNSAHIEHVFVESEGTAHEWQTWRKALNDFAPRLFK